VCTLTAAESIDVDDQLGDALQIDPAGSPGPPWRPWGRGGLLLPQDMDSDGMAALVYRRAHG
ncbi:MAG: hypothetical protein ACR2QE_20750, partial [Acidimicrobiales bacterium]